MSPLQNSFDVAMYAEEPAEHKEREARLEEEAGQDEMEERLQTVYRMTSPQKQRSRPRKSMATVTTTGSGEKGTKSAPSIRDQSTRTSKAGG